MRASKRNVEPVKRLVASVCFSGAWLFGWALKQSEHYGGHKTQEFQC